MADFIEKVPNGLPKLPADYWVKENAVQPQENPSMLDKNLHASLEDISVFNKKKD